VVRGGGVDVEGWETGSGEDSRQWPGLGAWASVRAVHMTG
jgi:hypothetical protein